jgi:cytochrome c peroxidase
MRPAHYPPRRSLIALCALTALCASGCSDASPARAENVAPPTTLSTPQPSAAALSPATPRALADDREQLYALGRKIFFDEQLSEPAGTSCASCHDPAQGYAGNHGSKLGVARGSRPGHFARRNTPSLLYLKFVRKFHFHWEEDAPIPDAVGGFFWDGRADSITALVRQPLLHPDEMGNTSPEQVASKLRVASYADELAQAYKLDWQDSEAALRALGGALEAFLTSDRMAPFSSKFDDFVRGTAQLTALEAKGLSLFRNSAKGGCDTCHKLNEQSGNPQRSLFTDYGFEALAVPRNLKLPDNRVASRYDLGLCEPDARRFPMAREQWCGNFRTPSLRNVALRKSYMHNGAFSELREVVEFYATREIEPRRWYKRGVLFDDVPERYREQVSIERVPYDRHRGQKPRLDPHDIDAIVAFLRTLSDTTYD